MTNTHERADDCCVGDFTTDLRFTQPAETLTVVPDPPREAVQGSDTPTEHPPGSFEQWHFRQKGEELLWERSE